jgi:chaperonin GroEL
MKTLKFGEDARKKMKVGIDASVDMAKVTLGGKGKIVMINTPGAIHSTMDGVTVLKNIAMTDDIEDMGVKLVLEAAEKQVGECGDGTTSVSILLQAIIDEGIKEIDKGADPLLIRTGIEKAVKIVIKSIEDSAKEVGRDSDEIFQVAKVSAHGDEDIATIIAEAISKTGEHGSVTVEETRGTESYVDIVEGFKVHSGWLSPDFINTPKKQSAELQNCFILIYEGKIHDLKEILEIMAQINQTPDQSLLIISDNLDGDALSSLSINVKQGRIRAAAINPVGLSNDDIRFRLQDLATAVGCEVFSPDQGDVLSTKKLTDLGFAKKVIVEENSTLIIEGNSDDEQMKERISVLETQANDAKTGGEEAIIRGRLATLTGSVGVIYVGGTMGTESKERKDRIDDAKGAAEAALENGVVPGGGISLLMAKDALDKETANMTEGGVTTGMEIVSKALELPFRQIITNAGLDPEVILKGINSRPEGTGYNVVTNEYLDMVMEGILDPAKVEINVVTNASLVATQFLNTEGVITPEINSRL